MMIALVILAFGLLIVGAALPVGLEYNRTSNDLALGEAATEYGLDVITQMIRTTDLYQPPGGYEPFIKIRPLLAGNIDAAGTSFNSTIDDDAEKVVGAWASVTVEPLDNLNDWNSTVLVGLPDAEGHSRMPCISRFYPPVTSDSTFTTSGFFASPYTRRKVWTVGTAPFGAETLKAQKRLVSWTAFYRRASYARSTAGALSARGADPTLYELIVVASRRPSENHRFARQAYTAASMSTWQNPQKELAYPTAVKGANGNDRFSPVPWLATFTTASGARLPQYPLPLAVPPPPPSPNNRNLLPSAVDLPNLEFLASAALAKILPPGSIFIPARNDALTANTDYADTRSASLVGFVPHTPDATPIYEVLERIPPPGGGANPNNPWRIIVKNPGVYPYVQAPPQDPTQWPVWVIPPAVSGGRNQEFDTKSPIIGVARRFVQISPPVQ